MAFKKYDSRKPRVDLIPPRALAFCGHILGAGAIKYSEDGWKECKNPSRYVAAALRHTLMHLDHEFTDPETGIPHLAAVAVDALIALDLYLRGVQDRTVVGNYFAIVKRISPTRGKIQRRFKSFTKAWEHVENEGLDFRRFTIKTVSMGEKIGKTTNLPKQKLYA